MGPGGWMRYQNNRKKEDQPSLEGWSRVRSTKCDKSSRPLYRNAAWQCSKTLIYQGCKRTPESGTVAASLKSKLHIFTNTTQYNTVIMCALPNCIVRSDPFGSAVNDNSIPHANPKGPQGLSCPLRCFLHTFLTHFYDVVASIYKS